MMTSSNGNIFRVTGPLCGEFTGPGEFPAQRPVTRSFDVFFDLCPNKRLSKQPWGWWFETTSWSLWRHCNAPFPSQEMRVIAETCFSENFTMKKKQSFFQTTRSVIIEACCSWISVYLCQTMFYNYCLKETNDDVKYSFKFHVFLYDILFHSPPLTVYIYRIIYMFCNWMSRYHHK